MDDKNRTVPRLRPEARPLTWDRLDRVQQKAFEDLVVMLGDAVDQLDLCAKDTDRTEPAVLKAARQAETNRLVLLAGDRGTGKTTMLYTLMAATLAGEKSGDAWPSTIQVGKLRERLVWLSPLNLETLPGPANLLASILTRVEQTEADQGFGIPRSGEGGRRGILERSAQGGDLLADLRQLKSDVALAWDGNLDERGGHLDPDPYAVEVLRAEQARLRLNPMLGKALDGWAGRVADRSALKNPLFILPIDDVDLNPTRVMEVLRLLRMISVNRLFFIVAGHLTDIDFVMFQKTIGDIWSTRPHAKGTDDQAFIRGIARGITTKAITKILPQGQRVYLSRLDPDQVLSFRPRSRSQPLKSLLLADRGNMPFPESKEALRLDRSSSGSLFELLFCTYNEGLQFEEESPDDRSGGEPMYRGLRSLSMTPREAVDLWIATAHQRSDTASAFLDQRMKQARELVAEAPITDDLVRRQLLEGLCADLDLGWSFDTSLLRCNARFGIPQKHHFEGGRISVELRGLQDWQVQPLSSTVEKDEKGEPVVNEKGEPIVSLRNPSLHGRNSDELGTSLNGKTSGAVAFLHDIMVLDPVANVNVFGQYLPLPLQNSFMWFNVKHRLANGQDISVNHAPPEWKLFHELDHFSHIWNAACARLKEFEIQSFPSSKLEPLLPFPDVLEYLLYVWIAGCSEVLSGRRWSIKPSPHTLSPNKKLSADHWRSCAEEVSQCYTWYQSHHIPGRPGAFDIWLMRLVYSLRPENCTPNAVAVPFVENGAIAKLWLSNVRNKQILTTRLGRLLTYIDREGGSGLGLLLIAPRIFARKIREAVKVVKAIAKNQSNLFGEVPLGLDNEENALQASLDLQKGQMESEKIDVFINFITTNIDFVLPIPISNKKKDALYRAQTLLGAAQTVLRDYAHAFEHPFNLRDEFTFSDMTELRDIAKDVKNIQLIERTQGSLWFQDLESGRSVFASDGKESEENGKQPTVGSVPLDEKQPAEE